MGVLATRACYGVTWRTEAVEGQQSALKTLSPRGRPRGQRPGCEDRNQQALASDPSPATPQ